jgi:hypothetical protein
MANFGQATYVGTDIIIQCDSRWDCCQREQAKYKVRGMNANAPGAGVRDAAAMAPLENLKKNCQRAATERMDALSPGENAEDAEAAGAAPCLVEQLRNGGTRQSLDLQMDHPFDTKLGGAADGIALIPLNAAVNNAFGGFARNVGDRMISTARKSDPAARAEVRSVSLVCPPSSPGCPEESHSEGTHTEFPSHWWKTPQNSQVAGSYLVLP